MIQTLSESQLIRLATYAAVATAVFLIVGKFVAWQVTSAMSLQASLIDSILDGFASLINLFAVRHALKPADKEHRFGHGKAESLAGLGQSAFIAASALWLLIAVFERIANPEPILNSGLGTVVMVGAVFMTVLLVMFQRYVIRRTRSIAIEADSLHYQSDLLTNIGVLISLNVTATLGWDWLDPLVGAAIAGYIIYTSWHIAAIAWNVLMDRELADEDRDRIAMLATNHPAVIKVSELKTRSSGQHDFIQMHLGIDARLSFIEAHSIAQQVINDIRAEYPRAEVIIYKDPIRKMNHEDAREPNPDEN